MSANKVKISELPQLPQESDASGIFMPAADENNRTYRVPLNRYGKGAAGGDLEGEFPNPTIKPNVELTGSPTAPTPLTSDNSNKVATTEFVKQLLGDENYARCNSDNVFTDHGNEFNYTANNTDQVHINYRRGTGATDKGVIDEVLFHDASGNGSSFASLRAKSYTGPIEGVGLTFLRGLAAAIKIPTYRSSGIFTVEDTDGEEIFTIGDQGPTAGYVGVWARNTLRFNKAQVSGVFLNLEAGPEPSAVVPDRTLINKGWSDAHYVATSDERLSDSRMPKGTAGGSLTGTYPNPAIKSSVNLPGSPTTTTQAITDNSTRVATTAFVKNAIGYKLSANFGYVTKTAGDLIRLAEVVGQRRGGTKMNNEPAFLCRLVCKDMYCTGALVGYTADAVKFSDVTTSYVSNNICQMADGLYINLFNANGMLGIDSYIAFIHNGENEIKINEAVLFPMTSSNLLNNISKFSF